MKDRRDTPKRVSHLGIALDRLRREMAAFDAMRGAPTRELAVANAQVLTRVREVIEAAYPSERVLLRSNHQLNHEGSADREERADEHP